MFLFSSLADSPRILAANSIGIFVSIFTNFLLNDRWTWGDRNKVSFFKRLIKFYAAASFAAAVQLSVTWASITYFWSTLPLVFGDHNFSPSLGLMTGIASGMFINFVTSHFWAFKDES
jgi:putative flippase GtrA